MPQLLSTGLTKLRLLSVIALVGALAVVLVGGISAQEADTAMVRVVHASPDASAVDVLVDGESAAEGLEFQDATDYIEVEAGEHQFQVVPSGGEAADAVIDATATLEAGMSYSVVAVGSVDSIESLIVEDEITEPVADMAYLKVVHAAPDAPDVDVATADGTVIFDSVTFMGTTDYMPVEAGGYDLELRATGTEDVAVEAPGLSLEAGTAYSAYAMGLAEDDSLTVVLFEDRTLEQEDGAEATPTEAAGDATPTEAAGDATPTEAAAEPTATGTGGGDVPSMPGTGAGGAVDGSDSTLMWIIGAASLMLLAAGAGIFAWSRRSA